MTAHPLELLTRTSPAALEAWVASAPAAVRAELAWATRLRVAHERLATAPLLTDALVDEYLSAVHALLERLSRHTQEFDVFINATLDSPPSVDAAQAFAATLRPVPRAAFWRVTASAHVVTAVLQQHFAVEPPPTPEALESALHAINEAPFEDEGLQAFVRGLSLVMLAAQGYHLFPRPRAIALVMYADRECRPAWEAARQLDERFYMPWYFPDAPGAEAARGFAAWSVDGLLDDVSWTATPEELKAWRDVVDALNASRIEPVFP
jgi:hypothetical protein